MRLILALALLPLPAFAWGFSPDPICTLTHENNSAEIVVTFDVTGPEYTLTVRPKGLPFPEVDTFGMTFQGGREISIGTSNHMRSDFGKTLTVRDSGFGNVLDGLEFNDLTTVKSGHIAYEFDLTDAAPAVRAFRACPFDSPATS